MSVKNNLMKINQVKINPVNPWDSFYVRIIMYFFVAMIGISIILWALEFFTDLPPQCNGSTAQCKRSDGSNQKPSLIPGLNIHK